MDTFLSEIEEERKLLSTLPEDFTRGGPREQGRVRLECSSLHVLSEWNPEHARKAIISKLGDRSQEVVKSAGKALARLGDETTPALIARVFDRDSGALEELLARSDPDLTGAFLTRLSGHGYWIYTKNAVTALVRLGDRRGISAIQEYLNQGWVVSDLEVPLLEALFALGGESVMEYLLDVAAGNSRLAVRAAETLTRFGESAVGPVAKRLRRAYGEARSRLADVLAKIGDPAVPAIIGFVYDKDEALRELAVNVLRRWGWVAIVETILALRADDVRIRRSTALDAPSLGSTAVVPGLIVLLEDDDPSVQIAAAHALGEIRDPSAVPAVIEALGRAAATGDLTRQDFVEALAVFGPEIDVQLLECLTSHNINRRRGAAAALADLSVFYDQ